MYVVYKEGVYIQGIIGIFEDKVNAKDEAIKAMELERDDYHTMVVVEIPLNKRHFLKKEIYQVSRVDKIIYIKPMG